MDTITNLPITAEGYTAVLVISDAYSGYVQAFPLRRVNAEEVIDNLLRGWIAMFGVPETAVSDGGPENYNSMMKRVMDYFQIKHVITQPGISKTNGLAERRIKELVAYLRKYLETTRKHSKSWSVLIPSFCLSYNITRNNRGFPPYFLAFGQSPNFPGMNYKRSAMPQYDFNPWAVKCRAFAEARDAVMEWRQNRENWNKRQADKHAFVPKFQMGDIVYLRNSSANTPKLRARFTGPFIILELKETTALIRGLRDSSRPFFAHLNLLKLATQRNYITLSEDVLPRKLPKNFKNKIVENDNMDDAADFTPLPDVDNPVNIPNDVEQPDNNLPDENRHVPIQDNNVEDDDQAGPLPPPQHVEIVPPQREASPTQDGAAGEAHPPPAQGAERRTPSPHNESDTAAPDLPPRQPNLPPRHPIYHPHPTVTGPHQDTGARPKTKRPKPGRSLTARVTRQTPFADDYLLPRVDNPDKINKKGRGRNHSQ